MMFSPLTKSLLSTIALCSSLLVGVVPAFGQRAQAGRSKDEPSETRVALRPAQRVKAAAYSDGKGALVTWQSESEANVVGYDVFRFGMNGLERVNKSLVIGAGLRSDEEAQSGKKFQLFDPTGGYGSWYQIEVVRLDGRRLVFSSAVASPVNDISAIAGYSSEALVEADRAASGDFEIVRPAAPKTVAAETRASLLAPSVDNQQWIAGQASAKIAVRQEGIYRVLKSDLQTAGFNVSGSSKYWRLFSDGNEQAIRVASDGSYFEFYGRGRDTRESDTRVYYLVADTVKGKRMPVVSARTFTDPTLTPNFANTYVKKYRTSYSQSLLNGDAENYFGDLVSNTSRSLNISLKSVDSTLDSIQLTVKLLGAAFGPHGVLVKVNGTNVGTMSWSNREYFLQTFSVPMSAVVEGSNTISLTSTATGGGYYDYSFVDTIAVSYSRKFNADSNRLAFVTGTGKRVSIDGFTGSSVFVYDVTAPESPQIVGNASVGSAAPGNYAVTVATSRSRSMYAVQDGAALTPASVTLNTPSTLSSTSNQANYLIVSHKNFMTEANAWAAYRTAEGYTTKVVDIEDVFDEFSYGSMSTDGMRAFFQFAEYSWSVGPDYVLLVGDATYDYRGYEASPFANYVPTRLFDTLYEETGSDDALVDFNGDGLAEIAIGRVPARTSANVTQLLQKTRDFEATSATGLSTRGALFAYDDVNDPNYGSAFKTMSEQFASQLPAGTPTTFVYRYQADATTVKTTLLSGLNSGKFLINWSGHGSTGIWANNNFFGSSDAIALTNGTNLSVFTMLTCLNGYFVSLTGDNLAESLIKANGGGAAATWASSGKTTADVQSVMANRFYSKVGGGTITRLGDLIKDAKLGLYAGRDVKLSWVLLGDPLLKMR